MTEQDLDAQSPAADLVRVYLNGIGRTALLNAEQEVELAKQIEADLYARHLLDSGKRMTAAKKRDLAPLIVREGESRAPICWKPICGSWCPGQAIHRPGMPLLDLIQEGNLGLIRAMEKFDYAKGFSSPPTPPGGSGRPSPAAWPIRVGPSACPSTSSSRSARSPASSGNCTNNSAGRPPTRRSPAIGHPAEKIADLLDHSRDPVSLDMPVGNDERHRSAISSGCRGDVGGERGDLGPAFGHPAVLATLDEREQQVIRMRYGLTTASRAPSTRSVAHSACPGTCAADQA